MKGRNRVLVVIAAVAAVISFYAIAGYAQPPGPAPKPAAPAEAPKPGAPPAAPAEAPKPEGPAAPGEAPTPEAPPAGPPAAPPAVAAPAPAPAPGTPGMVGAFLWVNFILGLWLLISPWVMGGEKASLKWSTTIVGLIVAVLSIIGALS